MKYTPQNLVQMINDLDQDGETKTFREQEFEFDDCYVTVSGIVDGTFVYQEPTYEDPPFAQQTAQTADLWEVVIGYDEETYFLDAEEIYEIEKLLTFSN